MLMGCAWTELRVEGLMDLKQSPGIDEGSPVFARLDTPTLTGPACSGVPQTRRPQRRAPINHNSTRKDITIWNHQKHTHRRDSEDIVFGLLMTQTDILLQMPSNRILVAIPSTPGPRASTPIKSAFRTCTFKIWYRPER